ncbi:hypothetical protein LXA43DRAFT_1187438 [Ganoderma leucocontextum]|nr:hypothetical protein LXA43DRAFT_1187438 [Ganoderma leucocontextum]
MDLKYQPFLLIFRFIETRDVVMQIDEKLIVVVVLKAATIAPGSTVQPPATVDLESMALSRGSRPMSNQICNLLEGWFKRARKGHEDTGVDVAADTPFGACRDYAVRAHHQRESVSASNEPPVNGDRDVASPVRDFQPEAPPFALPTPHILSRNALSAPAVNTRASTSHAPMASSSGNPTAKAPRPISELHDPAIPPINAYGTLSPPLRTTCSTSSFASVTSDGNSERRPLLGPFRKARSRRGAGCSVAGDLIPFGALWRVVGRMVGLKRKVAVASGVEANIDRCAGADDDQGGIQCRWANKSLNGESVGEEERMETLEQAHPHTARLRAAVQDTTDQLGITHSKHRPRLSVLDERGVVSGEYEPRPGIGRHLGGMYGCLAAFEDSLATLERILTTPLPFVYSVYIWFVIKIGVCCNITPTSRTRSAPDFSQYHCLDLLVFLPFQLIDLFGYYAILGVCIAAFICLGLIAAGEEIEQPFGYDENDLRLDLNFFCSATIHADIERSKRISCPNV